MDSQKMKNLLYKNKNQSSAPKYKRAFPRANGQDFRYRPLSTEIIDSVNVELLAPVRLHSNIPHPDFPNNKFGSNFRCLGKGCPLCRDYFATDKLERESGIQNGNAWKKRANNFVIYWMLDRNNNNELTLVHLDNNPYFIYNKKTKQKEKYGHTLQELVFQKIENALNKNLAPFNYRDGNDIVIRSKKVDNKVKWNIWVEEEKNTVSQEVVNKLKDMPKLSEIYRPYTWEELECVVRGVSLKEAKNIRRITKGNTIKEKVEEEKNQSFDENVSLDSDKTTPEVVDNKKEEVQKKENKRKEEPTKKEEDQDLSIEDSLLETKLDEDDGDYSKNIDDNLNNLFSSNIGEDND